MNRPRRDPHGEWLAETGQAGRPRRQFVKPPTETGQVVEDTAPSGAAVVMDPKGGILVLPDLEDGSPSEHDLDVLGAARALADRLGLPVVVAAFDAAPSVNWSSLGADAVVAVSRPRAYDPEGDAAWAAKLIGDLAPRHVLAPDTIPGFGDVLRRVSARTNRSTGANVTRIEGERIVSTTVDNRLDRLAPAPGIVLLAPECALHANGRLTAAEPLDAAPPQPIERRIEDRGEPELDRTVIDLTEADFILSGGDGVSDWQGFQALAKALNATIGGTRVVCDKGILPKSRQIGASGTLVDPRCYLAFGIAGAPQHLQGIAKCKYVIAVNTDLHADMIRRADLAIVADAQRVMPALTRLVKERLKGDQDEP